MHKFLVLLLFALQCSAQIPRDPSPRSAVPQNSFPFVNTSSFGSIGDGIADDSAPIQAALDAVGPTGGTIIVPQGTYKISRTLSVKFTGGGRITIWCAGGREATRFKWTGVDQGRLLDVADPTHWNPVTIEGCGFIGQDANHRPIAIYLNYSNGHRIFDNFFGDSTYNAIVGTSTFSNIIQFNKFYGPQDSCIKFISGASAVIDTRIRDNEFGACGVGQVHGYALEQLSQGGGGSNWLDIEDNDCEGTEWNGCWYLKKVSNFKLSGNRTEVDRHSPNDYAVLTIDGAGGGLVEKNELSASGNGIGVLFTANGGGFTSIQNNYYPNNSGLAIDNSRGGTVSSINETLLRSWISIPQLVTLYANPSEGLLNGPSGMHIFNVGNEASNPRKNYFMDMYSLNGGSVIGWGNEPHEVSTRLPQAPSGAVYLAGDRLYDSYFSPTGQLGWVCATEKCTWNGSAWSGTWNYIAQSKCRVVDGTRAPVTGNWATCDEVVNTTPSEMGMTGSRYVITGWRCIAGGAPGNWVPERTLTGN